MNYDINQFKDRLAGLLLAESEKPAEYLLKHLTLVGSHTRERFTNQHTRDLDGGSFLGHPKASCRRVGNLLKNIGHNNVTR